MTAVSSLPKALPHDIPEGFVPTPRHPSRAVAGLLLAAHRHADFELLDSGLVRVPSRSTPGDFWTIDPADGRCPCPIYRYGDAKTGVRGICHHTAALDLWLAFFEATGGEVSIRVEERHDSRFGLTMFDAVERSPDYPAGRQMSTALSFEGALWEVIELMQAKIGEAG